MMSTQTPSGLDQFGRDLDVLIRARYPLIAVSTAEEPRFRRLLETLALSDRHRAKGLFWWSRTQGLRAISEKLDERAIANTEDPVSALEHIAKSDRGLYVLADFDPYVGDALVQRLLRELAWSIKSRPVTVFLLGASFPDVPGLAKELTSIELALPDEAEVERILTSQIEVLRRHGDEVTFDLRNGVDDQLRLALLGLTASEIESALAKAVITHRGLSAKSIPLILDEKRNAIRAIGALTYSHPEPVSSLGGYANLRSLLTQAAVTFTPQARAFGVEPSKGVLMVGLPGCGKDLCKKIASGIFGRPLLDLDMAALMGEGGGVIGSAGIAMKRALSIATTLKAVLGLSEFEKGVGGMKSSAQSDAGETARTIGSLLSWMQEQQDVFVFATANDVRQLAPEQIRQGRFSQIVFVDLPTEQDRADIFAVHLAKRGREPMKFDGQQLAEASLGFSGAEIESAVKAAILDAYIDGARDVTDRDLVTRCRSIRPTSEVKKEDIDELRKWAREHMAIDVAKPSETGGRRLEF